MDDSARNATGQLGQYAHAESGSRPERPLAELLKDIIRNIEEIIRCELRLAKTELRDEAVKGWAAGRQLLAGIALGLYAIGFLLLGVVYALALVMPYWAAALCVGIVLAAVAAALIGVGRGRLRQVHAKPEQTIKTVKENVEWIKNPTN